MKMTMKAGDRVRFKDDAEHQQYRLTHFASQTEFVVRELEPQSSGKTLVYFEGHWYTGTFADRLELIPGDEPASNVVDFLEYARGVQDAYNDLLDADFDDEPAVAQTVLNITVRRGGKLVVNF